jgi:hypothetical protein
MNTEVVLKWRCPIDDTPPENTEMLVKNPHNGSYNITNYRPAYGIFTCQSKSESMYGWKYFVIDDLNKIKMSKVVKPTHPEMKGYKNWTEVSDILACGLFGVEVKDKSELTEEELNLLNQNK